tara:strand:- start:1463 stop:1843 length:381 start_codon:yes stop_codon:yes gene_type:complete
MSFTIEKKSESYYRIVIKDFNDDEFNVFMGNYVELFSEVENDSRISLMFSSLELTNITLNQILKLSLFLQKMKPTHRKKLEKFAIVVTSEKIIKMLNIVFVLVPPVRPYIVVMTDEDGERFLNNLM